MGHVGGSEEGVVELEGCGEGRGGGGARGEEGDGGEGFGNVGDLVAEGGEAAGCGGFHELVFSAMRRGDGVSLQDCRV